MEKSSQDERENYLTAKSIVLRSKEAQSKEEASLMVNTKIARTASFYKSSKNWETKKMLF